MGMGAALMRTTLPLNMGAGRLKWRNAAMDAVTRTMARTVALIALATGLIASLAGWSSICGELAIGENSTPVVAKMNREILHLSLYVGLT
jgi:hypothetical protein